MAKAQYRMFAGERRRVIYGKWPDGTYSVTVVGLLPGGRFRKGRRDYSFNATSKADADHTLQNTQKLAAAGRL